MILSLNDDDIDDDDNDDDDNDDGDNDDEFSGVAFHLVCCSSPQRSQRAWQVPPSISMPS